MRNYPHVAIIIINWNGWKDTIECLTSIQQLEYPNYCMVVIDNGSVDDSVGKIKEWASGSIPVESKFLSPQNHAKLKKIIEYDQDAVKTGRVKEDEELTHIPSPLKLVIIKCSQNFGFAKGNNIGLSYALRNNYEYIWLLNNDTVVDKKSLTKLIEPFKIDSQTGMTGSKVCYYEEPDKIWFAGAKIDWFRGESFHLEQNRHSDEQSGSITGAERLTGCSILVSSDLCRNVGLLDENFYLYVEEVDWCIRALKKNYKVAYVSDSIVYHKIIREKNSPDNYAAVYCYYQTRNFLHLIRKHIKAPKKFIYLLVAISYKLMLAIKNFIEVKIMGGKVISYPHITRGICDFLSNRLGKGEI